jgi:hypothetical protein
MERNKIESLFKDKLEGLIIEPSNEARERFAGKIQYQRRRVMIKRISIAASILLFMFAGIYSIGIFQTDKIDLSMGESFDAGDGSEIAILNEVPGPQSNPQEQNENPIFDEETAINMEYSSTRNSETGTVGNISQNLEGNEIKNIYPSTDIEVSVGMDQEYDESITRQVEESTYIEYFVADPDMLKNEQSEHVSPADQQAEPMKITIEYIASGDKSRQSETKRSNFYSKLDNMKSVDEVLGDIRTYKDKLFALDFKKEEKVNNEEKSTE